MKASQPLRADFERDGLVSIEAFLGVEEVAETRRHLQRFIAEVVPTMPDTEVYCEVPGDRSTLKQLQGLGERDPWFGELIGGADSKFLALAETLLGEPVRAVNLQYFNKPAGVGQPTPPHQDGFYFHLKPSHAVTMWLALEEVTPEQGCVNYVVGSQRYGMRWHGRTETLGFSQGIMDFGAPNDVENSKSFPCQAGHLLAHHSLTVHWADGNVSPDRSRQALGLVYFAESCGVNEVTKAAYQRQLDEELKRAGKI